jgi:ubiquinone/menaquinone biosynthesis C-methylase UbiE
MQARDEATRAYYDDFSGWYEKERGRGYHQLIDDLEVEVARPFAEGRRALEVGCGTGLILQRVAAVAAQAKGIDISPGMLAKARERGLDVCEGLATKLPFDDESFDLVYSFKVLAHVPEIREALAEMARVCAPGGVVLAEFYNPHSVRYLAKRWRARARSRRRAPRPRSTRASTRRATSLRCSRRRCRSRAFGACGCSPRWRGRCRCPCWARC